MDRNTKLSIAKHVCQARGFSILELAVVVSILSILAGISIPAFYNFVKSSRIDQAKAILNSAIAECLQQTRTDPGNAGTASPPEDKLSGLEAAGYKSDAGKNTCSDFLIKPSDPNEDYLFPMGFMVRNGKVTKIAIPASDRGSESACKSWGTCGIPPELQAEWDRLAKIEADKKACNDAFYTFLNSGSKGQKNVWDDASQSCSRAQWVLDGTRYTTKEAYDAAFIAKVGKECAAKLSNYANNNPPNGKYTDSACEIDTYFFNGKNLETNDSVIFEAAKSDYNDKQCSASESTWIAGSSSGAFVPPNGLSCTAKWKCGTTIYTDEPSYNTSTCKAPPPAPTPSPNPPKSNCWWATVGFPQLCP
jgi:prepilin-type N-terminal cleavage/methylation domain-containing protein